MMKRTLGPTGILTLVVAAVGTWGTIGRANQPAPTTRDVQTLSYAAGLGVDKLNPMLKAHGWCEASSMMFNRLWRVGGDGRVEGDLVKSVERSDDERMWFLTLKDNVFWHDGTPLTPADVIFTLETLFDAKTPTDLDLDLKSLGGWDIYKGTKVALLLWTPDPTIDARLSEVPILPAHLLKGQEVGTASFNEHPIGTGPYRFDRREGTDALWLRAHEKYHEGPPPIKTVQLISLGDDEARAKAIADRSCDFGSVKPQHFSLLSPLGPDAVRKYATGAWRGLAINLRGPIWQDVKTRKAIAVALDRKAFVEEAAGGLAKPALVPIVPESWAYPKRLKFPPTPDLNRARDLLTEAGWSDGPDGIRLKDGQRLVFRLIVWKDESFRRIGAEVLERQLAAVGIDVQMHLFDNEGYNNHAAEMGTDYDGFIGGWGGLSDPLGNLVRKFKTGGSQNHMGYSDPMVDRLLDQAMLRSDHDQAREDLTSALGHVLEAAVLIPLVYPEYAFASSRRIEGLPEGPIDSWYEITKHAFRWRLADDVQPGFEKTPNK